MMILPGIKKSRIILAGDKSDPELRAKINASKRGVKAKKRLAEADADFEAFMISPLVTRAEDAKIRAGKLFAAYVAWKEAQKPPQDQLFSKTSPMGVRAFGMRMRQHFKVHEGQGGVVTYLGVTLTRTLFEEK